MANEKKMDCVILGLLSHEPLTGYEIKKRINTALKFFWSASYGSIYPTLKELVLDGKVTKFKTKENGRNKIIYTITNSGRQHLKKWLSLPVEKDELRFETLLKLFFGSEIGGNNTLEHIKNFEYKAKKELPFLAGAINELEKIKNIEPAHTYYMLTARFGVKIYEAYLEWCKEAAIVLAEKAKEDKNEKTKD